MFAFNSPENIRKLFVVDRVLNTPLLMLQCIKNNIHKNARSREPVYF